MRTSPLLSTLLLLAIATAHAYNTTPSYSRRTFLTRAVTAGTAFAAATTKPTRAHAIEQQQPDDSKEAEKRRKQQEKEAQRLAEETKKRLAVGRIGTI